MAFKILIVGYSQTGQLAQILNQIEHPLAESDRVKVTRVALESTRSFAFPWRFLDFFDVFPESVALDPPPNRLIETQGPFDLVILGYQPWFLSPSLPTTAFLQSKQAQNWLKDTPVITVVGCRNMWGQAHLKMQSMLEALQARHIDNVVLTDQGHSLATFVTTPRWLLTGKKQGVFGLPDAGISDQDIRCSQRFGHAIADWFARENRPPQSSILHGLQAVEANPGLLQSEKIGARSFAIWGKLIRKVGPPGSWQRKPVLVVYVLFLITMIVTVVPLTMLLKRLLRPLLQKKLTRMKQDFEAPSGSDNARMKAFPCR
ncbi:hypothetical protein [Hydrogenovibrio halophilus]|uniref:hypothetical protein n=1 Tax=Hydrogenovibrio halophilus TaxID=373391 RepID=UPI00037C34AE|nr:hypothetical protein [Hydrogenovibrio halophilus]